MTTQKLQSSHSTASSGESEGHRGSVTIKDEVNVGVLQGEVKPQKACVNCRRSKVKCVHDGGPPCRRCKDSKQECKFRLRAVSV